MYSQELSPSKCVQTLDTLRISRRRTMYTVSRGSLTSPRQISLPTSSGPRHGYSYRNGDASRVHTVGAFAARAGCAQPSRPRGRPPRPAQGGAPAPADQRGAVRRTSDAACDGGRSTRRAPGCSGRAARAFLVRPRIALRGVPDRARRRAAGLRVARAGPEPRAAGAPRRLRQRAAARRPLRRRRRRRSGSPPSSRRRCHSSSTTRT